MRSLYLLNGQRKLPETIPEPLSQVSQAHDVRSFNWTKDGKSLASEGSVLEQVGNRRFKPNDAGERCGRVTVVRFKEVSARFPDKSAQVDDDFAFALGKFALTPFADCLGD
jgi:hypothetical protein